VSAPLGRTILIGRCDGAQHQRMRYLHLFLIRRSWIQPVKIVAPLLLSV
jgi:hypothetical protein